jgi:hypothetical protein
MKVRYRSYLGDVDRLGTVEGTTATGRVRVRLEGEPPRQVITTPDRLEPWPERKPILSERAVYDFGRRDVMV